MKIEKWNCYLHFSATFRSFCVFMWYLGPLLRGKGGEGGGSLTYLMLITAFVKFCCKITQFGQMLMCCVTNISNTLLAQCYRLETSPRSFYDFIKMTIWQDLAIFNSWCLPFLIVSYSPFQKMKHWNPDIIGYWVIGASC